MKRIVSTVDEWLGRMSNENTRRPRRTHIGRNALAKGELSGPYWLTWCVSNGIDPFDCSQVFHALEKWGTFLDQRTRARTEPMSTNYAFNLWTSARTWHRWLASPRGLGWDCDHRSLYAELPRWSFLRPTPVRPRPVVPISSLGELVKVAETIGSSPETRARNGALVALLVATGARAEEVRLMMRDNLRLGSGRSEITYQGKFGHYRTAGLPSWCAQRVRVYLETRDLGGFSRLGEEPLITPASKTLRVEWRTLAPQTFSDLVDSVVAKALDTRITAHGIRASLITDALARGHSVWDVAGWTGHEDYKSIVAYDRRRHAEAVAGELHGAVAVAMGEEPAALSA